MTSARSVARGLFLVLLLFGFGGLLAHAQFLSGIEGTARDQSGAVVSGAKVTVTDTQIGVTKVTTTNQAGYFRIDSIAASTFTVQIQMNGFKTWDQKGLALQAGEIRTLAPVLEVGQVSTEVTVSATEVAVDLESAKTGSVIAEETLQETPLAGQNVYGLSALTPGMTGMGTNSPDNYTNEYSININAAGLRQEQNGFQIDGAYTNTPSRGGATSISPNPEIVDTEEVRTNDFDAQKGRNAGATVDVFTKAGSNTFHGLVDYYFRNDSLTALQEFAGKTPSPFQRNEVGGSIGGPIIRNKLFFYGAIDVLRSSSASAYAATVETSDFFNWATTNLPNNVATQAMKMAPPQHYATSGFKTAAQVAAYSYFASPAGLDPTTNVLGLTSISYSNPDNGYQWSVRGDYYASKNDRFYVDALRTLDNQAGGSSRPAMVNPQNYHSDFANVDWTHTFSPRLLNEVGANIIRAYGQDAGVPTLAIPYVNVGGGMTGFGNWGPGNYTQTTMGWRDVMTATVRSHTLKFGFEQFNIRENDAQDGAFDRPTYNFNSLLDFVQDEALSESGTPVSLVTHAEAPYNRRYRALYSGVYVQDDWKIRPTFTLNAGVRYDEMANFFSILSPQLSNFAVGSGSTWNDQVAGGSAGFSKNNHVLDHNIWGLSPRVGFSWDVFGKGKTALRGGIGEFADQPPYLHITDLTSGNLPNFYTPNANVTSGGTIDFQLCNAPSGFNEVCPVLSTSNVTLNSNGGILVNGVLQPHAASLGAYTPNYKLTQVVDWTLSVQQELGSNLSLEANYSASVAHHLPVYNSDINRFAGDLLSNSGTATAPTLNRLNQNFGTVQWATSDGNSAGNFGSVVLTRRNYHGLALRGVYTFGKALDEYSNAGSLDSGSITTTTNVIQSQNIKAQRGRADFDIRQQFGADGTWTVPNHYNSMALRSVLGGWVFGGVLQLHTGLPFTVTTSQAFAAVCAGNASGDCYDSTGAWIPGSVITGNSGGDYNADGTNYDSPNVPTFGAHLSGQHKKNYLTGLFAGGASAFPSPVANSATPKEGTLGRNTYDQLGYNNMDFNFAKFFSTPWFFGEKMKIEARGEVINLFNRVNLTGVNSDMNGSAFGTSGSVLAPRSLQLHIRASF